MIVIVTETSKTAALSLNQFKLDLTMNLILLSPN